MQWAAAAQWLHVFAYVCNPTYRDLRNFVLLSSFLYVLQGLQCLEGGALQCCLHS